MKITSRDIIVPLDVPITARQRYRKNYRLITKDSGRLMLFAGDQKIEHLNDDFFGIGIHPDDNNPEHLFRIADKAKVGAFATQMGLIARYGMDYRNINYIIKLNSKSDLVKVSQEEPVSHMLQDIAKVVEFRRSSGLKICGIGYTIYLGSEYESMMLAEAAELIHEAHRNGLVAIIWIYPRGKAIKDNKDAHLIAGAAGVGACLGADFVKVSYPELKGNKNNRKKRLEAFKEVVKAAGRTKVICAGGSSVNVKDFLQTLHDQLEAGAEGCATARNIHQKSLDEAVRLYHAIQAITIEHKSVEEAFRTYSQPGRL